MAKKYKTQELLESKVLCKHDGIIDLKKLWAKEQDKEADPQRIQALIDRKN